MKRKLFVLLAFVFVMPNQAEASCSCMCVNGNVTPVCQNSWEVKPICTPRYCDYNQGLIIENTPNNQAQERRRVAEPDLTVFSRSRSLEDYNRENRAYALQQAREAAALRQLQLENRILEQQLRPATTPRVKNPANAGRTVCIGSDCTISKD